MLKTMPAVWRLVMVPLLLAALAASGCSNGNGAGSGSEEAGSSNTAAAPDKGMARNKTEDSAAAGDEAADTSTPASGPEDDGGSRAEEPAPDQGVSQPEPQAGMLTAGEWQDTIRWNDWQTLLDGNDGGDSQRHWSFYRFDRLVVSVAGAGKPVADAWVTVRDDNGETVWAAKTDIHGKAYVYAGLFRKKPSKIGYYVEVSSGAGLKRYDHVKIPRQQPLEVDMGKAAPLPDNVDLLFAVDTTGSMQDELDYLETELADVIDRVRSGQQDEPELRIGTDFYRDIHDEYTVKSFPFTTHVELAVKQIAEQKAKGGYDYPEAVDQALDQALDEERWSADARARLLFLVLDAPPHDDRDTVEKMHELVRRAAELGVRIVPVASSGVDAHTEYLMRFLAVSTGGTYIFLTDHSGIGKEHKDADVGEYEVRALNDLLVEVIRRYTIPSAPKASANGGE